MSLVRTAIDHLDLSPRERNELLFGLYQTHSVAKNVATQLRDRSTEDCRSLLLRCFDKQEEAGVRSMNPARTEAAKQHLGYSLPSPEIGYILDKLRAGRRAVLEIGCGAGLYAKVFGDARWIATDHPIKHAKLVSFPPFHAPIHLTSTPLALLEGIPEDDQILLAVWPEPSSTYLLQYDFKGRYIVLIGEPGVTGDESIWDELGARFHYECDLVCKQKLLFNTTVYESVHIWGTAAPPQDNA